MRPKPKVFTKAVSDGRREIGCLESCDRTTCANEPPFLLV